MFSLKSVLALKLMLAALTVAVGAHADDCSDNLQLNFHFDFAPMPVSVRVQSETAQGLIRQLTNLGWKATITYFFRGQKLINDLEILSPPDSSGRLIAVRYPDPRQASDPLSERDEMALNEVLLGIRQRYVVESAEQTWDSRMTAIPLATGALKSSLKGLGFGKALVLRTATVFEGSAIYDADGVIVMRAPWSTSSITLLDRQYKPTTPREAQKIADALQTGSNYTTESALLALKRGRIQFREH